MPAGMEMTGAGPDARGKGNDGSRAKRPRGYMIEPDRKEVLRYMGCRGGCSPELSAAIDDAVRELQRLVSPRRVYKSFEIEWNADGSFDIGSMHVVSRDLAKNLRGCRSCCLMAATLGLAPDHLIRRSQITDITRTLIYQAVSASMIEKYCDSVNLEIKKLEDGRFCRPRFSPGYGDFSIEYQRDFARLLQMSKTIGINLTESLMMMP